MTEAIESPKTTIAPKTEGYVESRTATGGKSKHSGDAVASFLAGRSIDEVKQFAVELTGEEGLKTKYDHLNVGQQRMNLGNRIRGFVAKQNKLAEKDAATEEPEGLKSGDTMFNDLAATYPDPVVPEKKARAKKEVVDNNAE